MPLRRYAVTPLRRYAVTPLRRYAVTPLCPYSFVKLVADILTRAMVQSCQRKLVWSRWISAGWKRFQYSIFESPGSWQKLYPLPLSHSALTTEISHYPRVFYPVSYPTTPECSTHWAIPLTYSALPLGYPTITYCFTHWAIPLSHSALPTELSYYPIVLYPASYLTIL